MLYLLSPAKTLDEESPVPPQVAAVATRPAFVDRAAELIEVLKPFTPAQLAELMDLSPALAALNAERYGKWSKRFTERNSRPAVWSFAGDVYEGLRATTLSMDDLAWAQKHLLILSGLYGILRPLDRLQPYRLEMGTTLRNARGKDLYAFWGDALAEHLNAQASRDESPVIINLASQEYFRAADRRTLKARVVECVFEDWKGGQYKVISFFAKRARGLMARYAIENRVLTPQGLQSFGAEGYAYAPQDSDLDRLVFRRRQAD